LQPGIVVNDRWNGAGDFATPECHLPAGRPEGWWEACAIWNGHWGYSPRQPLKPTPWVLETLLECRTWGGNFLLNSGPSPDGEMLPQFYARCEELAGWMRHSRDSLIGAGPSPGEGLADVPITTGTDGGKTWYLHLTPSFDRPVSLRSPLAGHAAGRKGVTPVVHLMRTGQALECTHCEAGSWRISVPRHLRTGLTDVVTVRWTGAGAGAAMLGADPLTQTGGVGGG
jgi:hypothetical protein